MRLSVAVVKEQGGKRRPKITYALILAFYPSAGTPAAPLLSECFQSHQRGIAGFADSLCSLRMESRWPSPPSLATEMFAKILIRMTFFPVCASETLNDFLLVVKTFLPANINPRARDWSSGDKCLQNMTYPRSNKPLWRKIIGKMTMVCHVAT